MTNYPRTDLAMEVHEALGGEKASIDGVDFKSDEHENYIVKRISIETQEAAKKLGKCTGKYVTIEAPLLRSDSSSLYYDVSAAICSELSGMLKLVKSDGVLVVGLGNRRITPDALGPETADKVLITRHMIMNAPGEFEEHFRSVSALSPGVLGITGIDTSELITMLVARIRPALVIAIDALAARSISRLATTFQISDAGVAPGSGVSLRHSELSEDTLGVRVISIGVPTVVDAATLAADVLNRARAEVADDMEEIDANLFVTPNNIDTLIESASSIIALGVNMALHPKLSREDVEALMSN